ncbi:hypothetical protein J437_LFUL015558 [Ladona fulva]|uniref:Craniofacial development protein 2-like n=1 Tax=Ladona fulva TaxID=123851 RepID=A0A8K0KPZ4_LADFU|nr:hypothetical protein J437_LFUL015558 [Ladona fulva]
MSIRIKLGTAVINVATCYVPQTGCSEEEKDEFWEKLDEFIRTIAPDEHILIRGDLNSHMGLDGNAMGEEASA